VFQSFSQTSAWAKNAKKIRDLRGGGYVNDLLENIAKNDPVLIL